jgi:hypothetical protein
MSGPVDGELAVAASRSRPVEQVRAFLGWVGEGRALTQTGRVRLADLRELVGLLDTAICPTSMRRGGGFQAAPSCRDSRWSWSGRRKAAWCA